MSQYVFRTTLAGISLAVFAALSGCNGGGSDGGTTTAGVGSGGTGYANGTVTGFGSVVVDGVTIDDRSAKVDVEVSPGVTGDSDVLLGHHVEVETAKDGTATAIHVMAEVAGPVQSIDVAGLKLVVAGQNVYVNTDANKGPVTVYSGYNSLTDIAVGDLVEVHAAAKVDAATGKPQLQATRIEKKTVLSFVRVSSVVSGLSTLNRTFSLGTLNVDYSGASVVPASRQIADGQRVVVFGPSISNNVLAAKLVRIAEPKAQGVSAQVGGVVSKYDSLALTFEVNGVKVNAKNAVIVPAIRSIANDTYVRVKGTYADSGELVASQVEIRKSDDAGMTAQVSLKGSVADFVSLSSFSVRGVPVDASKAVLSGCGATLSNELFVEVEGNISKTGIVATKVSCKQQEPVAAEVELKGTISSVDLIARTFVITSHSRVTTVRWTDLTSFRSLAIAALSGSTVKVEGYLQNNVVVARKISK